MARERGRARRAARRDLVRRRARASSRATPARCTCRAPTGYLPRAAIGALVAPLLVDAVPHRARAGRAREARAARRTQLARRRDRVPPDGRGRGEPGARARAPDRPHDPARLRRRRARRGRRVPLEVRRQREREGARVLEPVSRARPQRDLRVGPARRRHAPADHARRAAPRLRARAARARASTSTREIIDECVHQVLSVEAEGEGRLAQLLDLMYVGDWVSCYLALAERRRSRSDRRDLRAEGPAGIVTELGELLAQVGQLVDAERRAFETGPVRADATLPELRAALGGPTPETPTDSSAVIRALAAEAAPGVVGIPGPRDFGFVIGGQPSRGARRRLADERLGQQRGPVRRRARRRR